MFSLKFNPMQPDIIISGGWDNTIQIWDTRVSYAVRSIFGPHICGDAVGILLYSFFSSPPCLLSFRSSPKTIQILDTQCVVFLTSKFVGMPPSLSPLQHSLTHPNLGSTPCVQYFSTYVQSLFPPIPSPSRFIFEFTRIYMAIQS